MVLDDRKELVAELPSEDLVSLDPALHYLAEVRQDAVAVGDTEDAVDIGEAPEVKEDRVVFLESFVACALYPSIIHLEKNRNINCSDMKNTLLLSTC